jgi:hypothetical protein
MAVIGEVSLAFLCHFPFTGIKAKEENNNHYKMPSSDFE